jgi:putative transposase
VTTLSFYRIINCLYKVEVIHRREPWRSFEAIEYATLEGVDWFNHRRLLEPIGNISHAEAEDQYYAAADNIDMAAWLTTQSLRETRGGSVGPHCWFNRIK